MFEPGDYIVEIRSKEMYNYRFWFRVWPGEFISEHGVINKVWNPELREQLLSGSATIFRITRDTTKNSLSNWDY